jgi:predicted TIM-barrel fold metal-dependent hydrolase
MTIVVHAHANVDHKRPYGEKQARVFLERLLPAAPDITVQIAHLAGAGGYDPATDEALGVYAEAIERGDRRVRRLYFDASGIPIAGMWEQSASLLTRRIRQIGMNRILFGCDSPIPGNSPREFLQRWRKLPFTAGEFQRIEANIGPYLSPAR